MEGNNLVVELANRLSGRVIISTDISDSDLSGIDVESFTGYVIAYFEKIEGIKLLDKTTLTKIMDSQKVEKEPIQIEVIHPTGFKPLAKEIDAVYSFKSVETESTGATVSDFASYFNDRLYKIRDYIERTRSVNFGGMIRNIESVKQYTNGREIGVIGMVYDKIVTKNGHVLLTLEDETGSTKVLFMRPNRESKPESIALFESASKIIIDEVLAIKGKVSGPFVMANAILWPDIPIRTRKQTEENFAVAFTSDIHIGSKLFLDKQFGKFLKWLNGEVDYRKDLAGKVKYIVASGDLVDGIGIYPNQDNELNILDIYKQYAVLLDYFASIPDYIHVFLLPGNHDAVRRAEPQPALGEDLIKDFKMSNIHFVSDPGKINIGGLKVLGYHGTSLDSVIQGIPGCSYMAPETAMVETLKRRHLSIIYGYNPIVPSRKDAMVIDEVPDVLHMGHVHRNGNTDYHGTLVVNSGTWQARTSYQIKLGHVPTPAILPVYEAKSTILSKVDFNQIN